MAELALPIPYKRTTTGPDIAWYCRPDGTAYADKNEAMQAVAEGVRRGRTVLLADGEYWWPTADLTATGLVPKGGAGTANAIPLDGTAQNAPVTGSIRFVDDATLIFNDGANSATIIIKVADGLQFLLGDADGASTGVSLGSFDTRGLQLDAGKVLALYSPNGTAQAELSFSNDGKLLLNGSEVDVFTPITQDQYGTHPAFATRTDLDAYLLGGVAPPPAAPTGFTIDSDGNASFTLAAGTTASDYEYQPV